MSASAVIGALRVNLGLDSASFQKGVARSTASLGTLKGAAMAASAAVSAIGAAIGGPALAAIVTSAARSAQEITRLSQVAGTSAQELQHWSFGARTVGIEQEKLADILKDVNDKVGDYLSTGGGEMADFFEKIAPRVGVTAQAFRDLSGPQALQLYVSSLEKAGLSQAEMTFYMEAIASDSTLLLPLCAPMAQKWPAWARAHRALAPCSGPMRSPRCARPSGRSTISRSSSRPRATASPPISPRRSRRWRAPLSIPCARADSCAG
ncbi:hypothetical protein [Rhodobacter capsulatus]|uniref:hypothetical protein n=1 Tax=Rhodobacter capsulatus TaxID=1061 RepID=UPI004026BA6F